MNSDNEILVKVDGVSKKFCRDLKKSLWYGIKDVASELLPFGKSHQKSTIINHQSSIAEPGLRPGEFWANKDISFELRRGECIGLIGRNGAGKTTLLKMLNGLIKPDTGSIEMRGRVGALIALGTGFNPILTGRENIYVNGSILGLTKEEIDSKMDDIIDFASIEDFIDSPVQSYSSGMQVRLGFAVSTALNPDVLIVDEVLAVGDTNFRVKCYNRIRELLSHSAVILVSHSMHDIARVCNQVVVMKNGQIHYHGDTSEGIQVYNRINAENVVENHCDKLAINTDEHISGVESVCIRSETNGMNTTLHFSCTVTANKDLGLVRSRFVFFDQAQNPVAEWDSMLHDENRTLEAGVHTLDYTIHGIRLRSDVYRVAFVLADINNYGYHVNIDAGMNIEIINPSSAGSPYKI